MNALADLGKLLNPCSIAILGATPDLGRVGGRPIAYLRHYGYRGEIYPVNPKHHTVADLTCYPSIDALPEVPDMAVVAVPAKSVCSVVEAAQTFGVGAFTVYSSGFAESGAEGAAMERQLRELVSAGGGVLCGPNSQGVANFLDRSVAYFSSELGQDDIAPGAIGFAGHSGIFGGIMANECIRRGIGLGYLVSTGNEAGIDFADAAAYMAQDERISVVVGYIECVRDATKLRVAAEIAHNNGTPIVILKGGRNKESAAAAASHTGALAGAYDCHRAAFRQWGIVEAEDSDELFDLAEGFALTKKRPLGRGIGVLTNSGGIGVLCADQLSAYGLDVPALDCATEAELAADMLPFVGPRNPVDVALQALSDPDCIRRHTKRLVADPNIDAVLCFLGAIRRDIDEVADAIIAVAHETSKPVLAGWLGGEGKGPCALRTAGVPVYSAPMRAARVLAAMYADGTYTAPGTVQDLNVEPLRALASGALGESESRVVLKAAGIPLAKGGLAKSAAEAVFLASEIGYPVVLKIDSANIIHKSEVGGVALGVTSEEELRQEYDSILASVMTHTPDARIAGVGVYEMAGGEVVEMIAGMRRDVVFGPVVLLGMGGIFAETLGDKVLRIAPLAVGEGVAMVRELKGFPILDGARGRPLADLEALADVLERLSALALTHPDISEVDINPLMVRPKGEGVCAADALIISGGSSS